MLALGLGGGTVMLVDEATGEVKWEVKAHSQSGHHVGPQVAMSPDGMFVASGGFRDEHWRLWKVECGAFHRVGDSHDGTGECFCYLHLDQRVVQEGSVAQGWRFVLSTPTGIPRS